MKSINRPLVILAVLIAAGPRLCAQELGPVRPAGRVLLLPGDRGLEGDIEKVGDQYRVRRGSSEVWLPAEKALRLCSDWEDAFAFMKARANLGDPQERLRLAHWCQRNNLKALALSEAKAALAMRPGHAESRQLVSMLTQPDAPASNSPVKTVATASAPAKAVPPACDISSDAFALFATRVQPILMNTCVQCHSGGRGGAFQLVRTEGGQRALTQANLAAVLAQVRTDNPPLSPLLIKAVSPHGNAANAPIKDRQTMPCRALQGWIDALLAGNPHLRYQQTEAAFSAPEKTSVAFAQGQAMPPLSAKPALASRPTPRGELANGVPVALSHSPSAAAAPSKATNPPSFAPKIPADDKQQLNTLDVFDPAAFNRQAQSPQ
jgi:hypothetical protein